MKAIPWFNDFHGGFSMLGLGDIILPGLLISFAARLDAAKKLVRKCASISSVRVEEEEAPGETNDSDDGGGVVSRCRYRLGRARKALFSGYYKPLVIAYAIGLLVTYFSVLMTKTSQPAMLYVVPACLGTLFFLGWRRRELSELWMGPKVMNKADKMVRVARKIPDARAAAAREARDSLAETSSVI
jgi:signal peptide peptidase-like protein 2B